jgi:hypothetical protein
MPLSNDEFAADVRVAASGAGTVRKPAAPPRRLATTRTPAANGTNGSESCISII